MLREPTGSYLRKAINWGILNVEVYQIAFLSSIGAQLPPHRVVDSMARNLMLHGGAQAFESLETMMESAAPESKQMEVAHIRLLGDDAEFDDADLVAA